MNRKPLDDTEEIIEEADYVNAPACSVDKVAAPPDQKFLFFTQSFPLIAVCWLILLVIMGLRIHFTSQQTAENQNLMTQNLNLMTENQNLMTENQNQMTENRNLTKQNVELVIENLSPITGNLILMIEYQKLITRIQNLMTQNQELETQKNNLTEQIRDIETNWKELNGSRAQWSIDNYCPKINNDFLVRKCKPCQEGWEHNKSSCYVIHNALLPERITWEEARGNCRGKNSDLVVAHNQTEKDTINYYSWYSSGTNGYWIGLRVVDGRWKWIDGSDLTNSSWIEAPTEGHCAMSVQNVGWKSVSCDDRKQWICKQSALSV